MKLDLMLTQLKRYETTTATLLRSLRSLNTHWGKNQFIVHKSQLGSNSTISNFSKYLNFRAKNAGISLFWAQNLDILRRKFKCFKNSDLYGMGQVFKEIKFAPVWTIVTLWYKRKSHWLLRYCLSGKHKPPSRFLVPSLSWNRTCFLQ